MISIGLSSKIINILISLYSRAKMHVKSNKGISKGINITEGLLQGETLSPLLFSLFTSDLENFLSSRGIKGVAINNDRSITLLAYADDIVLFADTAKEMQDTLNALYEYCSTNKLIVNTQKTNIMIFRKGGRNPRSNYFQFGNDEIKTVNEYTYLGMNFTKTGLFHDTAEQISMKSNMASASTISIIKRAGIGSFDTISKLFNSLVRSVSLYGCEVWGVNNLLALVKIQSSFFKKLLNLPKCTPNYALRAELNVEAMECKVFKLILNWLAKILNMGEERYPKATLMALLDLDINLEANISKYNWVSSIKHVFFQPIEELKFFSDKVSFNKLIDNGESRNDLLNKFTSFLKASDKNRCIASTSLINYPFCTMEKMSNEYLNSTAHILVKRTIAQLRLLNKYCNRLIIKNKIYVLKDLDVCESAIVASLISCIGFVNALGLMNCERNTI